MVDDRARADYIEKKRKSKYWEGKPENATNRWWRSTGKKPTQAEKAELIARMQSEWEKLRDGQS